MEIVKILVFVGLTSVVLIGGLIYYFLIIKKNNKDEGRYSNLEDLIANKHEDDEAFYAGKSLEEIEKAKILAARAAAEAQIQKNTKKEDSQEQKMFYAGIYSEADQKAFKFRILIFSIVVVMLCMFGAYFMSGKPTHVAFGAFVGLVFVYIAPSFYLDRIIKFRREEVMYYLPLVIEQISIGVSSSLDIGPCIAQILEMATERDSHNPVTELLLHVERLIKSGLNLDSALVEVGNASGMTEVKHAFMFLAQCAKHGGELSKQLQELADSVMIQKQSQVEARITSLPVKATLPLTLVFGGFMGLLFAGLFTRLIKGLGG